MIIDFHAHIYPEKIAEKATQNVSAFYNLAMTYSGLPEELIARGSKVGVEKYIVHSTATKAEQVESINNYIIDQINKHPEFIGFGTIHPEYKDFEKELLRIKAAGLKGVKFHPDFQQFQFDDPKLSPIYDALSKYEIPVLTHAGDKRFDFSGPKRISNVIEQHPDLTVIAAHFGGYTEWEDSMKYLVGKNIYFDTSSSLFILSVDQAMDMIRKHGVDKFLFGTDFPMWDHEDELSRFNKLPLTQEEREMILYKNALKLLKL